MWSHVYTAYEYLIQQNVADGAKVIHRVRFAVSDATVRQSMTPVLNEVAKLLAQQPALSVQIDGFRDDPCSYEESFKLAHERVKAVSDYLRAQGVDEKRFLSGSSGNTHSAVPSDSEEGRAFNRRVELRPTY